MEKKIRINGIPMAMFLFFVIAAFVVFLIPCTLINEPAPDTVETRIIVTISIACAVVIGAVLFGYGLYCYLFTLEVSPSRVIFSAPLRKDVVLTREEITAFGLVSFGSRDTRLYVCNTDKEIIWAFYRQHMEVCKRLFGEKHYHKLIETEEKSWIMAVGVFIYCQQSNVYRLPYGNRKCMKTMSQILNMEPTPTGIGCASLWSSAAGEFR